MSETSVKLHIYGGIDVSDAVVSNSTISFDLEKKDWPHYTISFPEDPFPVTIFNKQLGKESGWVVKQKSCEVVHKKTGRQKVSRVIAEVVLDIIDRFDLSSTNQLLIDIIDRVDELNKDLERRVSSLESEIDSLRSDIRMIRYSYDD